MNKFYRIVITSVLLLTTLAPHLYANRTIHPALNQKHNQAPDHLDSVHQNNISAEQYYENSLKSFKQAAELGHEKAQVIAGIFYTKGLGSENDQAKAAHYYRLAADQDCLKCQKIMGSYYFYGQGVEKDDNKAFHYHKLAADQGDKVAKMTVYKSYLSGKGVKRDHKKAAQYFDSAIKYNEPHRQKEITKKSKESEAENFRLNNSAANISLKKALQYLLQAANRGHFHAQTILGIIYSQGIGVEQDREQAVHYLELASKQEHAPAQVALGTLYLTNEIEKSFNYLKLVAEKKDDYLAHALLDKFYLGLFNTEHFSVDQDQEQSNFHHARAQSLKSSTEDAYWIILMP